jgi:hypothetical protein
MKQVTRLLALPWVTIVALIAGGGCASEPTYEAASQPPPPPMTTVYLYPAHGQSAAQQDRDKYECNLWAVQQTGFDLSSP